MLKPSPIPRKSLKLARIKQISVGKVGIRPKTGRKRRKKGETAKLKHQLWQLCRQIIIKRYGNICYTCKASNLVGANLHTGHFVTSSLCSIALRYSLDNLRPQCYRCNIHLSGNWIAFERNLQHDGIDTEELKRRNEETKGKTYGNDWLKDKIMVYTQIALQEQ